MSEELHQCPYEKACKCAMADPCLGCETFDPTRDPDTELVEALEKIASMEADPMYGQAECSNCLFRASDLATEALNKAKK